MKERLYRVRPSDVERIIREQVDKARPGRRQVFMELAEYLRDCGYYTDNEIADLRGRKSDEDFFVSFLERLEWKLGMCLTSR